MTAPRQVLPGTAYLVTRRIVHRRFLLRPDRKVRQLFEYTLARACQLSGVEVHAYCVMSNHVHLVVTDPRARLPSFLQALNGTLARALNHLRGTEDRPWDGRRCSAVVLGEAADVVDKVAYVLANPVAAGLVRSPRDWPGAWSAPERIGGPAGMIRRPRGFFKQKGGLPAELPLQLTVPSGCGGGGVFRGQVEAALLARCEIAARERGGRPFLGVDLVLAQSPVAGPGKVDGTDGLSPRVAAKRHKLRKWMLAALEAFEAAYKEALAAWRTGDRRVRFPPGTYRMRLLHGARCEGAG